jgi:hypothetical protein
MSVNIGIPAFPLGIRNGKPPDPTVSWAYYRVGIGRQRSRYAARLYFSLYIDKAFDFDILTFILAPWRGKMLVLTFFDIARRGRQNSVLMAFNRNCHVKEPKGG